MKSENRQYKPVVVIPAFRRPKALSGLLESVNDAIYPDEGCTLIISLEGGAEDTVKSVAESFEFKHGEKEVIYHNEKLGLKSHIYHCAEHSQKYGSVIILEEDLIVSEAYYQFAVRALRAYEEQKNVAGISLYAQRFNETAQLPFEPMPTYFAGYFMRLACSWGQAWTADQWMEYRNWVKENPVTHKIDDPEIPENIRGWSTESWKREFNYYLKQTGRTIFYPYQSLTTNNSHYGGQHMHGTGSLFEVPIVSTPDGLENLDFPQSEKALVKYDMYMEAEGSYMESVTGFKMNEITLDLYGMKPLPLLKSRNWICTSKKLAKPDKGYALNRNPIELNLKYPIDAGSDTFFSLAQSFELKELQENRWAYIQLAIQLGTNRLSTGRIIKDNFYNYMLKRMKM